MSSRSCLMKDSSCSTVLDLCVQIFGFIMYQVFSVGERSGLVSSAAGLFSCEPMMDGWLQCVVEHHLAKICKVFPGGEQMLL